MQSEILLIAASGLFNCKWYIERNDDVRGARIHPLLHYILSGGVEGRDPNPLFDGDWYLQQNADVRVAGINPLLQNALGPTRAADSCWRPRLAIVAPAKQEAPYLLEWIAYHRALGVELFLIGDNGGTDSTSTLLQSLDHLGLIQRHDWRGETAFQARFYRDAIPKLCGLADICAVIDVDEYLRPVEGRSDIGCAVAELFARPEISAVGLSRTNYGSSGRVEPGEGLVIERFTRRAPIEHPFSRTVKTIIRPERFRIDINPHRMEIANGIYTNDRGDPIRWASAGRAESVSWNRLRLDHFIVKSYSEFETKARRGRADLLRGIEDRNEAFFTSHDRNEVLDPMPADLIERTKIELRRLQEQLKY
jgi:hypothetical protein